MPNEPVDTASKEKKAPGIPYNIIGDMRPNLIIGKLRYHFTSITAMFFVLAIITYKG